MQLLQGPKKGVRCLAFSPAGDTLAAGCYDTTIRTWQLATGAGHRLARLGATPKFLVWAPDGRRMVTACGSDYDAALLWCAAPEGELTTIATFSWVGGVGKCCLSPDGQTLYAPTRDAIRRWDTRSEAELASWPAWSPAQVAASADGAWVASTHPGDPLAEGDAHHVAVRDARTGAVAWRFEGRPEFSDAVAFSPDGTRLAVLKHQSLWMWEWPSGRAVCEHRSKKFFTGLAYAPDGRTLLTSNNDGLVRVWDGAGGEPVAAFDWELGKALCVAFAPDGFRAAAGGDSGKVVVWDVE